MINCLFGGDAKLFRFVVVMFCFVSNYLIQKARYELSKIRIDIHSLGTDNSAMTSRVLKILALVSRISHRKSGYVYQLSQKNTGRKIQFIYNVCQMK